MPTISAACHQVIFFAIARRITSCTFIARSTAALGYVSTLTCMEISSPPAKRTFHVLIPPDISCVNDTALAVLLAFSAHSATLAQQSKLDLPIQQGDYIAHDFKFGSGETLHELRLHYRTL